MANTPQKMLALGQEGLESTIKTIGLYRSKAKHQMETCRILVERHGGEVPRTREALEASAQAAAQTSFACALASSAIRTTPNQPTRCPCPC
ncbi:endonuclease III [Hydrogenophaga taeniospiralis CCUG 15921]|uniref:Endonuclease III n=1 Tax=Hydrogenophaga taeniospiralis CCUG 15921 TaxID=1281780 RepID=A0A9X4NRL8_9BURK|nr:endonuclease III [Hydrogenophaga taeniospiralis CCUG 15921]